MRGLGSRAREALERERERGPYHSIADFVRWAGLDRDAVERLAEVGAFLRFDERRAAIWQAGELARAQQPPGTCRDLPTRSPNRPTCGDGRLGVHARRLRARARALAGPSSGQLAAAPAPLQRPRCRRAGARPGPGPVRIGGIVICRQRLETANDFMFMTLEDEAGLVNVIVQPKVYHAQTRALREEPLLVIEGILQREGIVMDVIVRQAWPFTALEGDNITLDASEIEPAARAVPSTTSASPCPHLPMWRCRTVQTSVAGQERLTPTKAAARLAVARADSRKFARRGGRRLVADRSPS